MRSLPKPASAEDAEPEAWQAGYLDGIQQQELALPDMRRGQAYAMGYLTARYRRAGRSHLADVPAILMLPS